ncbi:MAG TPA: M23 family metallopeptidase [Methylomirabilota bacterium]|nr:M23 family metallopeptidase [Methylomirabilota bacterium]
MATASPGPLDHLPRPLSERGRVPVYRRRGFGAILLAGVIAATGVAVATSLSSGPLTPVGNVQGAVGSPAGPSARPPAAVVAPAPAPRATPAAAATPAPTPAPTAPAPATLTGYRWPLPHGRVTLPFGPTPWGSRVVDGEKFHDGVDLATFCGDRVAAAHAGTVLAAGRKVDRVMGWVGDLQPYLDRLDRRHLWSTLPIIVVIDDGNGYRSVYAHFGKVVVKPGQTVKAGQLLGYEGRTGRASGCHLHYGLFSPAEVATFAIDPHVVKRTKMPALEIARIDPMPVLGPRPKTPKPSASPKP